MHKKHIIVGSILVIGAIMVGSSLAWWTWSTSSNEQTNVVVTVGGITIDYEDGENITNNNLIPTSTKEKGISKDITVSSTGQVYLDLNMAVVTLDNGLKDASFKYEIYNGSNLVTGGNFANSNAGDNIALLSGVEVNSTPTTYTLYIWIDGNMSNPNTMYNQNFEFRLNAEATDEKPPTGADTITDIYTTADKTEVVNNDVTYNYATEVGMMEDIGGNIRYYGTDPNNYVSFNNELWRIIGVFNNIDDGTGIQEIRIKIARNESIGNYAFDNDSNDWSVATLNTYLNGDYLNSLTSNAQDMIGVALWNLGGSSTQQGLYANDYYTFERGTQVYAGNSTTWIGKIALIYPSDYMYASDLSKCSNDGYYWNNSCSDTSWLKDDSTYQWTITPLSSVANDVFHVLSDGTVRGHNNVSHSHGTRPALYLKSGIKITSGDGSSSNPFILG